MGIDNFAYDWAIGANEIVKKSVLSGDFEKLINYDKNGGVFQLSIPTPEHYLPLIYYLSLKNENEEISVFNYKYVAVFLSMTSFKIG